MKIKKRIPALLLTTTLLAACSGVMDSAQPARQYYMLMPTKGVTASPETARGPALSLSVGAIPGLDTDRVVAIDSDARLNHYANARWPDHLPEVLTSVIRRSLASSSQFSVVDEGTRASGDEWLLTLEVQQFYGVQTTSGNTSSVEVGFSGSIECGQQQTSFRLSDSNPVADERLSVVVAAHQRGLDNITRQLLQKVSESCS